MNHFLSVALVGLAVLLTAQPAQARFGKKSATTNDSIQHEAESVEPSKDPSPSPSPSPTVSAGSYRGYHRPHYRRGYWSGAFIPGFGFGYAVARPEVVVTEAQPQPEPAGVRLSAGLEGQAFRGGVTVGALMGIEGQRWGFNASGQNIAVRSDDGSQGFDHLQVATAHLSYAFLAGTYGRLRVEAGADAVFAPDLIVVGPTGGISGTLWIGGPFALEGSLMVTPWPYRQVDGKIGLALGLGPFGLRGGLRAQLLDDRGLVDGVVHQDTFVGPYVGASIAF